MDGLRLPSVAEWLQPSTPMGLLTKRWLYDIGGFGVRTHRNIRLSRFHRFEYCFIIKLQYRQYSIVNHQPSSSEKNGILEITGSSDSALLLLHMTPLSQIWGQKARP